MLLTRLPLGIATSFDLHVLGTPPALVLSQDQTLHKTSLWSLDTALMEVSILAHLVRAELESALPNFVHTKSRDSKDIAI